jgi:hypothetical protein
MKKYALLLVVLALSTSAWGHTVGTCNPNPCWNPSSCWNPCSSPGPGQGSGHFNTSLCGLVARVQSFHNAINTCHGSFSNFENCGYHPCHSNSTSSDSSSSTTAMGPSGSEVADTIGHSVSGGSSSSSSSHSVSIAH